MQLCLGELLFSEVKRRPKSQTVSDLTGMEAGLEMELVTTAEAAPVGCSGEEKRRLGKISEVSTKFNLTT